MADVVQVSVPDIGDFSDVPVIEVMVSPVVEVEDEVTRVTLVRVMAEVVPAAVKPIPDLRIVT